MIMARVDQTVASKRPRGIPSGRGRRCGLVLGRVAVAIAVVGSVGGAAVPADGATTGAMARLSATADPPATPPTPPVTTPLTDQAPTSPGLPAVDPSPRIRVLLARIEVIAAQSALTDQQRSAEVARDEKAEAQAAVDRAEQAVTDAERRVSATRGQLASTAVYAYMHAPGGDLPSALQGDATASGRERELFAASVGHHERQLAADQDALDRARGDLDAARRVLDGARQDAADRDRQVAAAASALGDASDELRAAGADEALPSGSTSWQLSIEGPSAFTAEELAQWYHAQGHGSQATVPIAHLTRSFVNKGTAEGIRGDVAFAQSIHETGWFANIDTIAANNFAGIGHCSACPAGFPFATADMGVLAQIQLLESYAEADPIYDRPRAAPTLDGPRGCCQTWSELAGVWASDPDYGRHILARYAAMLEWLVAKRTAGT